MKRTSRGKLLVEMCNKNDQDVSSPKRKREMSHVPTPTEEESPAPSISVDFSIGDTVDEYTWDIRDLEGTMEEKIETPTTNSGSTQVCFTQLMPLSTSIGSDFDNHQKVESWLSTSIKNNTHFSEVSMIHSTTSTFIKMEIKNSCNSSPLYQKMKNETDCHPGGEGCLKESINFGQPESKKIKVNSNVPLPTMATETYSNTSESVSDNSKDKDFIIDEYDTSSESTDDDTSNSSSRINEALTDVLDTANCAKSSGAEIIIKPFSVQIRERKISNKTVHCKFCQEDVGLSTNFLRHLERHHRSENEVVNALQWPKGSKERRQAISLLRNATNFDLYITGTVRPNRKLHSEINLETNYYPCVYCKGLFLKGYLKRHAKSCISRKSGNSSDITSSERSNHLSKSQTIVACAVDATETISKLNVKEQVFDLMKGDDIAFVAKKDLLIAHFGESYMKKHKRERMAYACSTKMRELARLLIRYRQIINNRDVTFKELLNCKNFDTVLLATRDIVGYDPEKKTFESPSLAMHMGTSLKMACDELTHLILKDQDGFKCKSLAEAHTWLKEVKKFKSLVDSRWNIEISSLANKDLQEKRWNKPLLLPLVSDIKKFRDGCFDTARDCEKVFSENNDNAKTYTLLVQSILALLIVFNRRRIGDVQFLKIGDYLNEHRSNIADFEKVLTKTEKLLTTKYKRIVNSGKGSRAVVILVPEVLQKYINLLLQQRGKYILPENDYMFATPGSKIKWGKGDVALRELSKNIKLENPQSIRSSKLRKHIATVMQLLSLSPEEAKQFATFMGHTQKTHEEFYELPIDIYQTAKVSKLLLLMEKGTIPSEHKGKSLAEINLNADLEYAMESDNDDEGAVDLNVPAHESGPTVDINGPSTSHKQYLTNSEENEECDRTSHKNKKDNHAGFSVVDGDNRDNKNPPKKSIKKIGWTNEELASIKSAFGYFIEKKTYPSTTEIKQFLKRSNINRSIPNL